MTEPPFQSFAEFWPHYVREHANRRNRLLHVVGTSGVLALVALSAATGNAWLLVLTPVCGYGFAWYGHFFVQRNVPATFTYPFWSLLGDAKLFAFTVVGRMQREVERVLRSGEPLSSPTPRGRRR